MLLANFQTLIVFYQGSLGDRPQRFFVFCRQAFPQRRLKLEQRQFLKSPHKLTPLEFFKGIRYHSICMERLRIAMYSPGTSVGSSLLHSNRSA